MLLVGGKPVLRHVLDIYAAQGVTDFVLAAGYRREAITAFAETCPPQWSIDVVDTGESTDTGERVISCLDHLGKTFFATYGDGLGNVDVARSLALHQRSHAGATLTAVPLPSPYGTLVMGEDDRVRDFREKPSLIDHPINAGFFVFERMALQRVRGAGPSLERDLLPALAAAAELVAYRHDGFWRSMDTQKDVAELDRLATEEGTPWLNLDPRLPADESWSPARPGSSARTSPAD